MKGKRNFFIMNKTTTKTIFIISVLSLFVATSVLQAQTLRYAQNIYLGLKNYSVTTLQSDLSGDSSIYPEKLVTGYFGPLTQKAVQRFQAKYGIVNSGTPSTTGYGRVGPKTRAKLNELYSVITLQNKWGCKMITQGVAPDPNNPPPIVCGYIPTCPSGQSLITSLGNGVWPDGSRKGAFSCSYTLPPSVAQ